MITTITTITTVSIISVISSMGLTAALGIVAVVGLLIFLTTKELAGTTGSASTLRIAKFANVGILPLTIAFAVIILGKITEMLF